MNELEEAQLNLLLAVKLLKQLTTEIAAENAEFIKRSDLCLKTILTPRMQPFMSSSELSDLPTF